jgi:hypothetical protein
MSCSRDELVSTAEVAAHGALFLFSGQTLATLIAAVGSIIIARLLGPDPYGILLPIPCRPELSDAVHRLRARLDESVRKAVEY